MCVFKRIAKKGDIYVDKEKGEKLKNGRIRENISWVLIQELEESYDITILLNKLMGLIKGKEDVLREIKEIYLGIIIVSVIIEIENNEVPGILIEEGVSVLMARIGAEIDIDIYVLS